MKTEAAYVWGVFSDGQLIDAVFASCEREATAYADENGYLAEYPTAEVQMLVEGEEGYQAPRIRKVR